MVATHFDDVSFSGQIVLRPNQSWSWRANVYFVATLMVVSLSVASIFSAHGIWLILPFTLLELSILSAALYYCVRRTHITEVLTLSPARLVLERGINKPTLRLDFDRYFARFLVEKPQHPWYRKRIALRCRNEEYEVGRFLSDEEKDQLVQSLRGMINRLDGPDRHFSQPD